jgi:hypothetical protein
MFYYISFQKEPIPFLFVLSEEQLYEKGQFTEVCKLGGGTVISSQIEVKEEHLELLKWEQLKEEDKLIVSDILQEEIM